MPKKSTSKLFQDEETKKELKQEDMNLPVNEDGDVDTEAIIKEQKAEIEREIKDTKKVVEQTAEDIVDIDLSHIKKKKFRINGDNSKILELNTSDMSIVTRLKEAYPRLNALMDEVTTKFDDLPDEIDEVDEKLITKVSDAVQEIDEKMRREIDFIFQSNVSEICGSDGSMWDPIDGSFRYEHIIDKLAKLYENNLDKEYANMKRRVESKAGEYVKLQDHKKRVKR